MYSLKDIFNLYKGIIGNSDKNENNIPDVNVSHRDLEILRNSYKKTNKLSSYVKTQGNYVKHGQVYLFPDKYIIFVILDAEEYPYTIAIASQFIEFETSNSVVLQGNGEQWLMLNIVRYASDRIIEKSICIDEVSDTEMEKLYNLIFKDTKEYSENIIPLPTELHREFERNELERTRWMIGAIFDDE